MRPQPRGLLIQGIEVGDRHLFYKEHVVWNRKSTVFLLIVFLRRKIKSCRSESQPEKKTEPDYDKNTNAESVQQVIKQVVSFLFFRIFHCTNLESFD